jgi:hypothetical protein
MYTYEVLKAANVNVTVFWHVMPHSLVDKYFTASSTLKTEAGSSSKKSVPACHTSQKTIIFD